MSTERRDRSDEFSFPGEELILCGGERNGKTSRVLNWQQVKTFVVGYQSAVSKKLPHHSRSDLLENAVAALGRPVARNKGRRAHRWPPARQAA